MRLIYNSDAQRLQKNFDDKTPITVSELFRSERTASVPMELFLIDNDGGYATPGTSDYEVLIGRQAQAITTGKLTLTFTGTTEEIDLSKPKLATRIEAALNAVSEVNAAGGVDVVELNNGRAFQITFRSVGSKAAITAGVKDSMQPASVIISEVTAGTGSTREVQLLTLEEASLAEISTSGWSANSNPALAISTLVEGTANTREVVQLSVTGDPAPGSFFVVSNSEPIPTEATAAQVKTILNSALSSDIGSVKKTGERIWQITYKTNGDKTALSAGTHNLVKRPSVTGTLSLNTTALAYAANSDGSDLSVGFTLKKSNEVLLSENVDLAEPFAEVIGSSAMLNNDSLGALFTIGGDDVNKGTAISLSGGLTYSSDTLAAPFLPLAGGTMTGNVLFGDNVKAKFGTDSDLEFYSDDSNAYIDGRKGDLYLRTVNAGDDIFLQSLDDIFLRPNNGTAGVTVKGGGAVELYFDGSKKIESTNLGCTISGKLIVNGDLDVSGTTTTFNSTVVTVDDPVFTVGGDTAPDASDNKDRGIEFRYFRSGESAKVGFFGYSNADDAFKLLTSATNNSEVFSGTLADLKASKTLLEDGSASAPSYSFSSNTDTGVFGSHDALSFSVNGTRKAYISTAGVTSDANVYHSPTGSFRGFGYNAVISTNSGYEIVFKPNDTEAARFDSSGRFKINNAAPVLQFVESDATATFNTTEFSLSGGALNVNTRQSDGTFVSTDYQISKDANGATSHKIFIQGTEAARLDSSGHLLLNSTSSTGDLFQCTATDGIFAARLIGSQTSGQSYGLRIRAGFTNADVPMLVENWSGTDLFKITGDGKVGIGGTPTAKLSIFGSGNTGGLLFDNGSDDNDFVRFYHASDSANSDFFITYDGTGGAEIALKSDGTIKLNESNGDNVCIGNSSASAKLDIRQDSGTAIRCEDGSGGYFVVNHGGATGIGVTAPSQALHVNTSTNYEGLLLNGNVAPNVCYAQNAATTPTWKAGISGTLGTAFSISQGSANTERLMILDGGNVGINCSPLAPIHIRGTALSGYVSGDVSPDTIAIIENDDNARLAIVAGNLCDVHFGDADDQDVGRIRYNHSANSLALFTNGGEQMRIDSSGKVGISTTSPQANLHIFETEGGVGDKHATIRLGGYLTTGAEISAYRVDGNSNNQGLMFSSHDATDGVVERMRINSSGNVGIANTNPSALHSDARNLVVGSGSGNQGITIYGGSSNSSNLYFADGTTGNEAHRGYMVYNHSSEKLFLGAGGATVLTLNDDGDAEIVPDGKGLILNAPNGTSYRITVANDGTVTSTAV